MSRRARTLALTTVAAALAALLPASLQGHSSEFILARVVPCPGGIVVELSGEGDAGPQRYSLRVVEP